MLLPDDLASIGARLDVVDVTSGQVLYPGSNDGELDYVYFPIDAAASMLATMANGDAVEAGTVGREGMVGIQAVFGSARLFERWISQVPGRVARIPLADFRTVYRRNGAVRDVVDRYVQTYMAFLAQSIACNRLHVLIARCARWLLLTQDRVGRDDFSLTQEFLAIMLGVRRPAVSIAAGSLQSAGMIAYARGRIRIVDRAALERASCECYEATTREFERIFAEVPSGVTRRSPSARPRAAGAFPGATLGKTAGE